MTSDSAYSSRKLDEILVKMDALNTAKNEMLTKLNTLGLAQGTILKDVKYLKSSFQEADIREYNSKAPRADKTEVRS